MRHRAFFEKCRSLRAMEKHHTVKSAAIIRAAGRRLWRAVAAAVLFTALGGAPSGAVPAESEGQVQTLDSSALRVIQGRITAIAGNLITVKTPDGYPGGPGIHAQFVTAGPALKIDISHSQALLPDGKQHDPRPLEPGDRVVMVLREPEPGSGASSTQSGGGPIYPALIIERVATADRMITH